MTARYEPSPRFGVPPEGRYELQNRVAEAIGAVSGLRIQMDRMNDLLQKLGDELGAAPHSEERAEQLRDLRARLTSRFDQLEALRGDLADLMVDAPAFVGDDPIYGTQVEPQLDPLPVIAGGRKITDLTEPDRGDYLVRVFAWVGQQVPKLLRDAASKLRAVVDVLATADSREARELQERLLRASAALAGPESD